MPRSEFVQRVHAATKTAMALMCQDDHDDWMNFGGGRYVDLMKVLPVQDYQVDNTDNPHGPGRKRPPRDPAMSISVPMPNHSAERRI
jgi:hypothetical protein